MAKKAQLSTKGVAFTAPVIGVELILTGCDVSINYRYKERTLIDGDIQIDSEEKHDYVQASGQFESEEQLSQRVAENPVLAQAIELAKAKSTAQAEALASRITQARTDAAK
ncbi:MAG: hypothetical protein E6R03_10935 [Hyphomicrobiaceae bacterium]|nr:MAG: hypothetical protein E6R03_10935 [Hyphomicrobiaceae bacterium]